jgi:hypothetical protein
MIIADFVNKSINVVRHIKKIKSKKKKKKKKKKKNLFKKKKKKKNMYLKIKKKARNLMIIGIDIPEKWGESVGWLAHQ